MALWTLFEYDSSMSFRNVDLQYKFWLHTETRT